MPVTTIILPCRKEPSNKDDKTLFPFGNNDKKNTITYGRIFIRNNPYSYSAFETGNGTTMNVTKCPIHNTQLVNGKCNEISCIFTEYEYISNGTTILDEKLPYNVYLQRQGSEKTDTK